MLTALLFPLIFGLPSDTTALVAGIEMPLVRIERGTYEREIGPGERQRVVLTKGFWLGKFEVTWDAWQAVMGENDYNNRPTHPVRGVTWFEITEFLDRASAAADGWDFRLPTEAEWEYAARSGSTSDWASGPDSLFLLDYAWIRSNAQGEVQPVGGRLPNTWGLHDMHGNVWEWVSDWMGPYPDSAIVTDPQGPSLGTERVRRGGSAVYGAAAARSSYRYQQPPGRGNGNIGFRVVAIPTSEGASARPPGEG